MTQSILTGRLSYMVLDGGHLRSKFSRGLFRNWASWATNEDDSGFEGARPAPRPNTKVDAAPRQSGGTGYAQLKDEVMGSLRAMAVSAEAKAPSGGGGGGVEEMQALLQLADEAQEEDRGAV